MRHSFFNGEIHNFFVTLIIVEMLEIFALKFYMRTFWKRWEKRCNAFMLFSWFDANASGKKQATENVNNIFKIICIGIRFIGTRHITSLCANKNMRIPIQIQSWNDSNRKIIEFMQIMGRYRRFGTIFELNERRKEKKKHFAFDLFLLGLNWIEWIEQCVEFNNNYSNAFFDLKTRTELSAPPETIYFGFVQSQQCTLSSWPSKSKSGAFGLKFRRKKENWEIKFDAILRRKKFLRNSPSHVP